MAKQGDPAAGSPLWKRLLEAYRVELVLTPARTPDGLVVPLVDALFKDPGWDLVYHDRTALVFLKGNVENRARFARFFYPKSEALYGEITAQ